MPLLPCEPEKSELLGDGAVGAFLCQTVTWGEAESGAGRDWPGQDMGAVVGREDAADVGMELEGRKPLRSTPRRALLASRPCTSSSSSLSAQGDVWGALALMGAEGPSPSARSQGQGGEAPPGAGASS